MGWQNNVLRFLSGFVVISGACGGSSRFFLALTASWVGSLDFNFLGKSRGCPLNPPKGKKVNTFCRGVVAASFLGFFHGDFGCPGFSRVLNGLSGCLAAVFLGFSGGLGAQQHEEPEAGGREAESAAALQRPMAAGGHGRRLAGGHHQGQPQEEPPVFR